MLPEKWDNWVLIYSVGTLLLVRTTLHSGPGDWALPLLVVTIWLLAQHESLFLGRCLQRSPDAILSAIFQLAALLVAYIIAVSESMPLTAYSPVLLFLIISYVFAMRVESDFDGPLAYFSRESIFITCFGIFLLFAILKYSSTSWGIVLVFHLTLHSLTIARNMRLHVLRTDGPIETDKHVVWKYDIGFREERGVSALKAVSRLPSSVLGIVAIAVDLAVVFLQAKLG
jgi:hypothetical protein